MNELNIITWAAALVSVTLAAHSLYRQWWRARLERRWQSIMAQYARLQEEERQP
jgi:hypothetical protein